jgi:peptidyl-prolyl cis-trans isomerase D
MKTLAPTLWIVIATFIIAIFAVWGGAGRLGEKARSETIATMGSTKISMEEYYQSLRTRLEAVQKEFRGLNKNFIQQLNIPQQVLEQMIQQILLEQKARELGIAASDQEVRDRIITTFQREGKFIGFNEYRQILSYNHISVSQFENDLKNQIVLEKIVQVLGAGVTVTSDELWENYKKQNESAKIEYVLMEESKIPYDKALPAAEVQAYFEKNKEKYALPERREGAYVFLLTEGLKNEIQVTEADIEKYYKDNLDQFKEPERIKVSRIYLPFGAKEKAAVLAEAQGLLARLNKGEDFGQMAKAGSLDDKAKEGGDWGYDLWKKLPAKEKDEIGNLSAGQTSGVIEGNDGVAILKVTEKEPEKTQTLAEVKTRIQDVLKDQKTRELAAQKVAQLEKSARKEKSLDVAAQKNGLKVKNTGLLKQGEALEDFDPAGSISQSLFGLKVKDISAAIYTFNGTGLAQLEKIEPPRPATFEEVKAGVEKDFRASKQKALTQGKIQEARAKIEGQNWEETAAKLGLEYKLIAEHKKEQYLATIGESPDIDRLAFSLPLKQTSEPVEFAAGYALVRVLERKDASREEFEKKRETEKNTLLETKRNRFLQAYLDKLRTEKEVKVNYNLFMQVNNDILSRFETTE